MVKRFLAVLLVATLAHAQALEVHNSSGAPFAGWLRRTVLPVGSTLEAGALPDGTRYALGRRIGLVGRVIDLRLVLAAGERRMLDLSRAVPIPPAVPQLHADPLTYYGVPTLAGVPLALVAVSIEGAAVIVHARGRPGAMLVAESWWCLYPDQDIAVGELVLVASDPRVSDVLAHVPADLQLRCGAATVIVPGLPAGAPLLAAGETLADGQCRAWPIVLAWGRADMASATALAMQQVRGIGNLRPSPTGRWAEIPVAFNAFAWTAAELPGAIARLHNWDAGPLGVAAGSGVSGAQEDQGFLKGSEGLGADCVRYLVALGQLRRPCHLLEVDGALLDVSAHPYCVVWSGRPDVRIGIDMLGKSRQPTVTECHGWWGPDREHWLLNTLAAGYELRGSYALQWELQMQARLFLLGETIDPALSTSHGDAARAKGWTMLVAALLHDLDEDRSLQALVDQRARDRIERIYEPELRGKLAWDVRDDPRWLQDIGPGYPLATAWYQQAVGAWGLGIASVKLGSAVGWQLAGAGARAVCDHAYSQAAGTWIEWDETGITALGEVPAGIAEGVGAHRTGWFRQAWFPMATSLASVLGHPRGVEINMQILNEARSTAVAPLDWWPR